MTTLNPDCLPLLPKDQAEAIYEDTWLALAELDQLNLNLYRPPRLLESARHTAPEQIYKQLAERIAWGLRVADSFDNQPLVVAILAALERSNGFAYLLAFTFFTATYQTDRALQPQGVWIEPVSQTLKRRLVAHMVTHLLGTPSGGELMWLNFLLKRVILWLPYTDQPDGYLHLSELEPFFVALDQRVDDVLLADHNGLLAVEEIKRTRQIIDRHQGKLRIERIERRPDRRPFPPRPAAHI